MNGLDHLDGEWNTNEMKGTMRKDLKFDEGDRDDKGEPANLLLLLFGFVMYRIYVQWKREISRTINNKVRRE